MQSDTSPSKEKNTPTLSEIGEINELFRACIPKQVKIPTPWGVKKLLGIKGCPKIEFYRGGNSHGFYNRVLDAVRMSDRAEGFDRGSGEVMVDHSVVRWSFDYKDSTGNYAMTNGDRILNLEVIYERGG